MDNFKTIIIKNRMYNGLYSKGSIVKSSFDINFNNTEIVCKYTIEFCKDEKLATNANISLSISTTIKNEEVISLDKVIDEITTNNNYKYNESHYTKGKFDNKYYSYVDVTIDNIAYELSKNDSLLETMSKIINANEIEKSVHNLYENLIK